MEQTAERANADRFFAAVYHSLDRKVCNSLNTCCIVESRAAELVPLFLEALQRAGERRRGWKLHVAQADLNRVPEALRGQRGEVVRAEGPREEPLVETLADAELGREWEWEETPEVSLKVVASVEEAVALFNAHSPQFAASLISSDPAAHERFYQTINAPFVGDGFTRWVDGQYALNRPELGLSNWENGRLFAGHEEFTSTDTLYFSLTTLTTVGFGDLSMRADATRIMAAMEGLLGQIYLITAVALLVGNLGQRRRDARDRSRERPRPDR